MNCKTGAYGSNVCVCEECGAIQIHYNSCRNRCCPMCQAIPKEIDSIVPLSYSERAVEVYDSARLEVLPGAGHGFSGEDARQAIDWILEYLNTHKN